MPVTFRILEERGLVVVCFSGDTTIDELIVASAAYLADPKYAPGQKQLVDLSDITSFERDYVRFMDLQAGKIARLTAAGLQSLAVYVAPTPISQEVGAMFCRSWDGIEAVVGLIQATEAEALCLLGQPETSIQELLAQAEGQRLQ